MPPDTLTFALAGTVYPTLHEPNNCYGIGDAVVSSSSLRVIITGANGATVEAAVTTGGNFNAANDFGGSYTAKVVRGSSSREMLGAQTSGDCNACHTETGANGAPGRILAP